MSCGGDGRAKVWRCRDVDTPPRVWHGYVPDTESPYPPCFYCGTWDWSFPTHGVALSYVNSVLSARESWRR